MSRSHSRFVDEFIEQALDVLQIDDIEFMFASSVKLNFESFSFFENSNDDQEFVMSRQFEQRLTSQFESMLKFKRSSKVREFMTVVEILVALKSFQNVSKKQLFNHVFDKLNAIIKWDNELITIIDENVMNHNDQFSKTNARLDEINDNLNIKFEVIMIYVHNKSSSSINSASKFVKSNQKIFAINVFASHQIQTSSSAIQSFDQQDTRNTQYQSPSLRSFQKTQKRRSVDANILHQHDEKFSLFSSDQNRNSFLHDHLQQINAYNETIEERQSRSRQRDDYIHSHSRSRSRHASLPSSKSDELRDVMLIRQNQFKVTDIDFFYFWYIENKNFIEYVINEKKMIYTSVQLFVQTIKQYVINNENVLKHLYLCLRGSAQIWWANQNLTKRFALLITVDIFCNALVTRYEKHSIDVLKKMLIESYIIKDVQKRRQLDEYVSILMRYAVSFDISNLIVLSMTWNALDKKLRRHVRRFDKRTTTENFIRDLKNAAKYYTSSDFNRKNEKKAIYQREMKSSQKQNFERFERYSKSYIESYSTNYFSKSQNAQPSRNWQTSQRNAYTSATSQNRPQYSQQYQISATQNLSSSQRITQYSTRTTQYSMISSAQKLLTNNASYNAFVSTFYEQYDYNADSAYDEKQTQTINENIKFEIFEHANFDDIITFFHAKTFELEIFNDEKRTRHGMTFMFCNICKKSYINNDDRTRLNNHMQKVHDIDTKSKQSIDQKRYINWMKHAILHVVTIRESSPEREYVTIQTRLYDEINENISICIDTESSVNFIDKSLLSESNLWNRLHNCHSITMRNIADERIVDQQMNISLYVIAIDDTMKRIETKIYVSKSIKVDVILNMNELDKIEDDIILWLDRKKMQLDHCHVIINFTSRDSQFVIFFANATPKSDYTDFKSCLKSFDDKSSKKSMRFAKKMSHLSYKSICISESSLQIKSAKIEEFQAIYDSNIAKLKLLAMARNFAFNFANVFILSLHQRAEPANFNWRARFAISNRLKRFIMNRSQRNRDDRRNLSDLWRKLSIWRRNEFIFLLLYMYY